jgi:hypothetical protein
MNLRSEGGGRPDSDEKKPLGSPLLPVVVGFGRWHLAVLVTGFAGASVVTAVLTVANLQPWGLPAALGALSFVVFAVFWWIAFSKWSKPQGVNTNEYEQLVGRLDQLQATTNLSQKPGLGEAAIALVEQVLAGETDLGAAIEQTDLEAAIALESANKTATRLQDALRRKWPGWLSGEAYLDAWEELHRGEEAAAIFAPRSIARAMAAQDLLRLKDSGVPQSDALTERAKAAIQTLEEEEPSVTQKEDARQDVRLGRNALNEYREEKWRGLIGFRDVLILTAALVWFFVYVSLLFAVAASVTSRPLLTASLFFLTGALVGLISQMLSQSRSDPGAVVEDFGLGIARVIAMPVLSGAVALLGVIIVAALHISVGAELTPSNGAGAPVNWDKVFDWRMNGLGFGVAALFGLSPDRLFDFLKKADNIKMAISSTEPSGRAST